MEIIFFLKCFFIGASACISFGPVTILTFNRGALYGFSRGFACALGSSLADLIFFGLALLGAVTLLQTSTIAMVVMDFLAACVLLSLGVYTLLKQLNGKLQQGKKRSGTFFESFTTAFLLTIFNPFVAIFFMFMIMQFIPEGVAHLRLPVIFMASFCAGFGTLAMLLSLVITASLVGHALSKKTLMLLDYGSGIIFILGGFYFMLDFVRTIFA